MLERGPGPVCWCSSSNEIVPVHLTTATTLSAPTDQFHICESLEFSHDFLLSGHQFRWGKIAVAEEFTPPSSEADK